MEDSSQQVLSDAQQLWRSGRYGPALRGFAAAARRGGEAEVLALLRALLALGHRDEALKLVTFWKTRMTQSQALAGYHALLTFAGNPAAALEEAGQLDQTDSFCRAVTWAVGAAQDHQLPVPDCPGWDDALDGMAYLISQNLKQWQAFSTDVLDAALAHAPRGGLCVECGVFWGRSVRRLAAHRDQVHGFDSFSGLPEDWKPGEPAGAYSTGGRLPQVPRNVLLYKGWFEDTLPAFVATQSTALDLLHVDCDLYSSTVTVLEQLSPLFRPGTVMVFDDYMGFAHWREHEYRALSEYCANTGLTYSYLTAPLLGREVAVQIIDPGSRRS